MHLELKQMRREDMFEAYREQGELLPIIWTVLQFTAAVCYFLKAIISTRVMSHLQLIYNFFPTPLTSYYKQICNTVNSTSHCIKKAKQSIFNEPYVCHTELHQSSNIKLIWPFTAVSLVNYKTGTNDKNPKKRKEQNKMHSHKVCVEISGWKETQAKKGLDLESRLNEKVRDRERLKELYVRG